MLKPHQNNKKRITTDKLNHIIAPITPLIPSAVGALRFSGNGIIDLFKDHLPFPQDITPRFAYYGGITDQNKRIIDTGLFVFFPCPQFLYRRRCDRSLASWQSLYSSRSNRFGLKQGLPSGSGQVNSPSERF